MRENKFRKIVLKASPVLTGLLVCGSLTSCFWGSHKISTKPVVQVNEHTLSVKEFSSELARKMKNTDAISAKDPNNLLRVKEEIVKNFIIQSLVSDWAQKNKIQIPDDTLDKEIQKYRSNYPDDFSFRKFLSQENISFNEWRDSLRQSLVEKEVFKQINLKSKPASEDELKKYYESHKEQYKRKEKILLRQIVLDEEAKAERIKGELKKSSFDELAKQYSIAPEGKNGGLVGWLEKGDVDFFDHLFSSPIGQTTPVFKSPFGFHIAKVEKKQPASVATFEEVKNQIETLFAAQKEQAQFMSWIDTQLKASKISKDTELINQISIETRGINE